MKTWAISYQTKGNEYFPDEITWYCEITANTLEEAINTVLTIEKKHKVTKFSQIRECVE